MQGVRDGADQGDVAQLPGRHVDRQVELVADRPVPRASAASWRSDSSITQRPSGEISRGVLGDRDEHVRRDRTAGRMVPPDQRLGARAIRPVARSTIGWYTRRSSCWRPPGAGRARSRPAPGPVRASGCRTPSTCPDRRPSPGTSRCRRRASRASVDAIAATSTGTPAMPTEALMTTSALWVRSGCGEAFRIFSARATATGSVLRCTITNSSPPTRATVASAGTMARSRRADLGDQLVTGGVPPGVVDQLEAVQVEEVHPHLAYRRRPGRGQQLVDLAGQHDPVGQAGQQIVGGLVLVAALGGGVALHGRYGPEDQQGHDDGAARAEHQRGRASER